MEGGCGWVEAERNINRQGPHGHMGRVGYVKRVIGKRKCRRSFRVKKTITSPPVPIMALQQLFMSCRQVFSGPGTVPSPADVQKLRTILGTHTN